MLLKTRIIIQFKPQFGGHSLRKKGVLNSFLGECVVKKVGKKFYNYVQYILLCEHEIENDTGEIRVRKEQVSNKS